MIVGNTIYELSVYVPLLESFLYYNFKKDNTPAQRIKSFLREQLRLDTGYYDDDVKENMKILHLLKTADSIEDIVDVLERTSWGLIERGLL